MNSQIPDKQANKHPTTNTVPIRITRTTNKALRALVTRCNRKKMGRNIKSDDVIALALTLITEKEIEKIKSQSLSSIDRFELKYKEYSKINTGISKDQFLELLLSQAEKTTLGEVNDEQ